MPQLVYVTVEPGHHPGVAGRMALNPWRMTSKTTARFGEQKAFPKEMMRFRLCLDLELMWRAFLEAPGKAQA